MPIKYDKLIALMREKGITSYTLKRDNIIGQATYKKIMEGGDIDTRTIAKLCKLLECQPGDILEYVPEEAPPTPEVAEDVPELSKVPTISKEGLTESQLSSGVEVLDLSINDYNMVKRAKCDTVEELIDGLNSPKCVLSKSSRAYRAIVEAIDYLKENL